MATLADGGRITERLVEDEITRLKANWIEVHDELGQRGVGSPSFRKAVANIALVDEINPTRPKITYVNTTLRIKRYSSRIPKIRRDHRLLKSDR
jgi:hypothetical protein